MQSKRFSNQIKTDTLQMSQQERLGKELIDPGNMLCKPAMSRLQTIRLRCSLASRHSDINDINT